jgi:hypothetical protein
MKVFDPVVANELVSIVPLPDMVVFKINTGENEFCP